MRPALDEGDLEFLQLLNSQGDATIQELCDSTGVTATAIRQRLARLQDQLLVARMTIRAGRGRPHHRYTLTPAGQRALGDNYAELAIVLWETFQRIENPEIRQQINDSLREEFIRRLGGAAQGRSLGERLDSLRRALEQRGFRSEIIEEDRGLSAVREHHCPYFDLAATDRRLCDLERDVFEGVLGVQLELVKNCHDGANCCEFRPVTELSPTLADAG